MPRSLTPGLSLDGLKKEAKRWLKALRANGLNIVAIHNHMIEARPVVIFLHYWGRGTAEKLATSFKAVLDDLGKGTPSRTRGQ